MTNLILNGIGGGFPTANLKGHWDASVSSSVHVSTGVNKWDDLSGNGNDLLQSMGSLQPTYSGSGTSSKITFPGGDSALFPYLSASFNLAEPITVYIVMNQIAWLGNHYIFSGGVGNGFTMAMRQQGSSPDVQLVSGGAISVSNSSLVVGNTMVVACQVDTPGGSTGSVNINGTIVSGPANTFTNSFGFTIGGNPSNFTFANFYAQEILLYSDNHNTTVQGQIISYLRSKWGI